MKQTHYYLYSNKRYENMKDCRESIGNGVPAKAFKHMLRLGIVAKVELNPDANTSAIKSAHDEEKKTT